ncbi:MAG: hypothetical protein DCC67_16725 [Planctomycetota bacterium]|nr:MAG: hypothetical protein DCC67_16725 [Planctomycetota bacterium]
MNYLAIILLFVFFAGVAMTVNEGLWSNTVSLFCVMFASMLAWYWGPTLGAFVVEQAEPSAQNEWAFWFASVWGAFFLAVTILRIVADRSSRVRMRIIRPLDLAGGVLVGLLLAVMFTSFAAYSLFLPFRARVWKTEEGAGWAQTTVSTFAAPMYTAGRAFLGEDFPDLQQ